MKKILLSLLLGLTVCCSIGLFACDNASCNGDADSHVHTEVTISAVEATCYKTGLTEGKKCSVCDQVTVPQKIVPKTEHPADKLVDIPAVDATCKQEGQTAGKKCSVCDEMVVYPNVIPKINHDFIDDTDSVVTYGTIDGVTNCHHILTPRICKDCGEPTYIETEAEHIYSKTITTPATCVTAGEYTLTCIYCGYQTTEEFSNADAHVWLPTATEGVEECSGCHQTRTVKVITSGQAVSKDTIQADTVLKLDNLEMKLDQTMLDGLSGDISLSADTVDKTTLTLDEEKKNAIGDSPVYDFSLTTSEGNVSNFNGGKIKITIPYTLEATDDPNNITIWYVNDDGEVEPYQGTYSNGFVTFEAEHFSYYAVVKLTPEQYCAFFGHSFKDIGTPASCEKDGYSGKVCTRCGYLPAENGAVKALGHSYVKGTAVSATCTEQGYTPNVCSNCNHMYQTELVAALGHNYQATKVVNATCQSRGYTEYTCSTCNAVENMNYVDKSGHKYANGACVVCKKAEVAKEYEYINLLGSIVAEGITVNMSGLKVLVDMSMTDYDKYLGGKYVNEFNSQMKVEVVANKFAYTYKVNENAILGQFQADLTYGMSSSEGDFNELFDVVAYGEVNNGVMSVYFNMISGTETENGYMQMNLTDSMGGMGAGAGANGIFTMVEKVYDAIDMTTVNKILDVIEKGIDGTTQGIISFLFENFFTGSEVDNGKKTYSLDWEKVIALKDDVLTLTVAELINKYLGEGAFEQLVEDIKGLTGATVGDLITLLGQNGITEKALITLINSVVRTSNPEFDITPNMGMLKLMSVEDLAQMIMGMGNMNPGNPDMGEDEYPDYSGENSKPVYPETGIPGVDEEIVETLKPMNALSGEDSGDMSGGEGSQGSMLEAMIDQYVPMLQQATLLQLFGIEIDEGTSAIIDSVLDFFKATNVSVTVEVDANGKETVDLKQIVNDAIKSAVEKLFTVEAEANGNKTYTFKKQVLKDLFADITTLTVSELIDKYIGSEQFEKLAAIVKDITKIDITNYVENYTESTLIEVLEVFMSAPKEGDTASGSMMDISSIVNMLEAVLDSEYSIVMKTSSENTLNSITIQLPSAPIFISTDIVDDYNWYEYAEVESGTKTDITLKLNGSIEYITTSEVTDNLFDGIEIVKFFTTDGVKEFKSAKDSSYVKVTVEKGAVTKGEAMLFLQAGKDMESGEPVNYYTFIEFTGLQVEKGTSANVYHIETAGGQDATIYQTSVINNVESEFKLVPDMTKELWEIETNVAINIKDMTMYAPEARPELCPHNRGYSWSSGKVVNCKNGVPGEYVNKYCSQCGKLLERNVFEPAHVYDIYSLYRYHDVEIVEQGLINENGSCYDGWYILARCKTCPNTYYLQEGDWHEQVNTTVIKDLSEYSTCGDFKIIEDTCFCGEEKHFEVQSDCDFGNSGKNYINVAGEAEPVYVDGYYRCAVTDPACSLAYAIIDRYETIDCKNYYITEIAVYTVANDVNTQVYRGEVNREFRYDEHRMEVEKVGEQVAIENGFTTINSEKCLDCGLLDENIHTETTVTVNGVTTEVIQDEHKISKNGVVIESYLYKEEVSVIYGEEKIVQEYISYTRTEIEIVDGATSTQIHKAEAVKDQEGNTTHVAYTRSNEKFYAECKIVITNGTVEQYNEYINLHSLAHFWQGESLSFYEDLNVTEYLCYNLNSEGEKLHYQYWRVEHNPNMCQTIAYMAHEEGATPEKQVFEHHYVKNSELVNVGSCAAPQTYHEKCETCKELVHVENFVNGHQYEYNTEKGVYVCLTCGLESANGEDGRIIIEQVELVEGEYSYLYTDKRVGGYHYFGDVYFVEDFCTYEIYVVVIDMETGAEYALSDIANVVPDALNNQASGYEFGVISFSEQDVVEAMGNQYDITIEDISLYNIGVAVNIQAENGQFYSYQYITTPAVA